MSTNNIQNSSLVLGGILIPLSGEGTFATFEPDPRYSHTPSLSGKSSDNKIRAQTGVLTISCYAHDTANKLLRGLVTADDAIRGLGTLPGAFVNPAGEKVVWPRGKITQAAKVDASEEAQVLSYTVTCNGYIITPPVL